MQFRARVPTGIMQQRVRICWQDRSNGGVVLLVVVIALRYSAACCEFCLSEDICVTQIDPDQEFEKAKRETTDDGDAIDMQDDGADVIVMPRVIFNYALVAVVFFAVGALMGSFVFPSTGGADDTNNTAALPEDFEAIVRNAVAEAIEEADIAVAQAEEDPGAIPGQRYEVTFDPEEDPTWGSDDAPIKLIEFSDFSCGFCGRFASETAPLIKEEFGDVVQFVYIDFPFLSQASVPAALAAECADDQDKFWEYHDQIFANQRGLGEDMLMTIAEQLELDMDEFRTCYDERIHLEEIAADYEYGQSLGVTGTPAFFLNGKFISGAQPIENFRREIEAELARLDEEASAG